ncbi:L-serine ammonia-lyase, iron-sulfur-dependent subunit beta [Alkaliphilus sp. MSJ-5]|uniref:L-serine deaminase n=1 Tax=Alkaliphilus flagellatus TaxID=2841507 RepID=A0ABS6G6F5_9FIRM|nr:MULTISPECIES: L-serine ammonia-lyase, iron-sulfur-dependent subunit beta [Alkaliphilus]MBU5677726.1 L-serine ammonia-lyase, iron-sulfur-dependent subunit beta [Alkaliphilus flagellatus]QUH20512.1 L-serine ammonia-lyase, iron-sulfur-dependent, subunit beta [Alkaliphilus sp. B6464]
MKEFSIFDVVGPNMIGPSSSHTAGACRIGKAAYKMAGEDIKKVTFLLHGSFAKTYRGHGTDKALVGGILGFDPVDERIKYSFDLAREKGIEFIFQEADLGEVHSNTVKVIVEKNDGEIIELMGSSIGGGNIVVTEINGLEIEFTGEYDTLIISHVDKPGVIAKVTAVLALYDINIAFMRVYRYSKGQNAFMIIETDNEISPEIVSYIKKTIPEVPQAYLVNIK